MLSEADSDPKIEKTSTKLRSEPLKANGAAPLLNIFKEIIAEAPEMIDNSSFGMKHNQLAVGARTGPAV